MKETSTTSGVSTLLITWQEPESRRIYPVARLMRVASGELELAYIRAALEAERQGFKGLPGYEDLTQVYFSPELPALFESRKGSRGRRIQLEGELQPAAEPANDVLDAAPLTLFVPRRAGALPERLQVFAPPLPGVAGRYWGVFVVSGVGRVPGSAELVERLVANEELALVPEPDNAYNPNALLVERATGPAIGYAPDYLANELARVPDAAAHLGIHLLAVHRINFAPAPPLYQVTCRYECDAKLGQALFHSTAYEPLSPRAFRD
ncbi:MAG: HIRAN domain-containing protein [Myxococcales bacterium]